MKRLAIAAAAVLAALSTTPASAAGQELITNGDFEINNLASNNNDWDWMSQSALQGWTVGPSHNNGVNNDITLVVAPGAAASNNQAHDSAGTWDHANRIWDSTNDASLGTFPYESPTGGYFVQGDGDSDWSQSFSQLVTGLTVGAQYELTFWQAAGQQIYRDGATTEWWDVTFGDTTQASDQFSLPNHGFSGWEQQTMVFTATSVSQLLTFLARGTPDAAAQPPMAFLDGVSMKEVGGVPEPATWATMLLGFGLVGAAARRRRPAPAVTA